jgi:hypothetical protein
MKKILQFIRTKGMVFIIVVIFLNIFFFIGGFFKEFIPLPFYLKTKQVLISIIATGYSISLPALLISKFRLVYKLFLIAIAIPICCLNTLVVDPFTPEQLLNSANLGEYHYHFIGRGSFVSGNTSYTLYKCNIDDLDCESIFIEYSWFTIGETALGETKLVVDEEMNELHVILNDWRVDELLYTEGTQPHRYVSSVEVDNLTYHLAIYPDFFPEVYPYSAKIFQCNNDFTSCQQLPFRYEGKLKPNSLEFDSETGNLQLFGLGSGAKETLIYSYGEHSRCHVVEGCRILEW